MALLIILWSIGQVFRDEYWITGICFYFPSPILAVLMFGLGAIALACRKPRITLAYLIIALLPVTIVLFRENRWLLHPQPSTQDFFRAVHWNVYWGGGGWNNIVSTLRQENADIYILSEAPKEFDSSVFARDLGEEYEASHFGTMAAAIRGNIDTGEWIVNEKEIKIHQLDCRVRGKAIRIFVVDAPANLWIHRHPHLLICMNAIVERAPDLVLGDFNAPRQSVALSPPPRDYHHAYDIAGSGWSYTWPVPLPVYSLDQCIVGPRIAPLEYRIWQSWQSDHCRQVLDFDLRS